MTSYQCIRTDHEEVAERTISFHFEKPADFQVKARQLMDSQAAGRAFPIASAPYYGELLVATRVGNSAFKRVLAGLPFGTELKLEGPMGPISLHRNPAKAALLLAGGIRIKPFSRDRGLYGTETMN
jgi:ferredoxin-NADP reductase